MLSDVLLVVPPKEEEDVDDIVELISRVYQHNIFTQTSDVLAYLLDEPALLSVVIEEDTDVDVVTEEEDGEDDEESLGVGNQVRTGFPLEGQQTYSASVVLEVETDEEAVEVPDIVELELRLSVSRRTLASVEELKTYLADVDDPALLSVELELVPVVVEGVALVDRLSVVEDGD